MSLYSEKFEYYFNKLKKLDMSSFFSEDISFHEYIHLKIIRILCKNSIDDTTPVSALVENSGVSPQAVSKLLRSIEEKNYIVRYSNKSDRRITMVKITDEGKRVFEITNNQVESVMDKVFSNFSDNEIKDFMFLTEKFLTLYAGTVDRINAEDNTL